MGHEAEAGADTVSRCPACKGTRKGPYATLMSDPPQHPPCHVCKGTGLAPEITCPACNARKELLAEGGDHEGVMLMQTIARMSRQIEDLGAKYRGALGGGFPVEVNGPAHAKMLIEMSRAQGKPVPWAEVVRLMDETIEYIHELGQGKRPQWHEVAAKLKETK